MNVPTVLRPSLFTRYTVNYSFVIEVRLRRTDYTQGETTADGRMHEREMKDQTSLWKRDKCIRTNLPHLDMKHHVVEVVQDIPYLTSGRIGVSDVHALARSCAKRVVGLQRPQRIVIAEVTIIIEV